MSYLLFQYERFYPEGGWADYVGTYETLSEAKAAADQFLAPDRGRYGFGKVDDYQYVHIVHDGRIILEAEVVIDQYGEVEDLGPGEWRVLSEDIAHWDWTQP